MYHAPISETYQSKRDRRRRVLESPSADLRPLVAKRNIKAVSSLLQQVQERLLEAVQSRLKCLPRAIEQLRAHPGTSLADPLDPPSQPVADTLEGSTFQQKIADLIQKCFPDMPRVSAEALAEVDVMEITRTLAQAYRVIFQSAISKRPLRTFHFVVDIILTAYGLMRQTLEELENIIDDTPALRLVFEVGKTL